MSAGRRMRRALTACACGVPLALTVVAAGAAADAVQTAPMSREATMALVAGDAAGASFDGESLHRGNDRSFIYQACYQPGGRAVAQIHYLVDPPDRVSQAVGTWQVDGAGALCLNWRQDGWTSGCYLPVAADAGRYAMTERTTKETITGSFSPGLKFDFCH